MPKESGNKLREFIVVLDGLTPDAFILQHIMQSYGYDEKKAKTVVQGLRDNGSYEDLHTRATEVLEEFACIMK